MRVCLYLEADEALTKSGFKRACEHQIKALQLQGIHVTDDPDDVYDLLHLQAWGPKSFYFLKRAKREGIPVVVHAHSVGAHDFRDSFTMSNVIAPLYESYLKFFYEAGDYVFTPTEFAKRCLLQGGITKPVAVVSNGVDRERFRFSAERRAAYRKRFHLERFTVFSAGNIIPRKGIESFLNVAERLPQFDFIWYGQLWPKLLSFHPKMYQSIEERPPNVCMPGFVSDAPGAYSAADLLFFPSRTETQGLVLLEAASLGLPLVVRDLPEYRDWLIDGVHCLKARSDSAFVEALRHLASDAPLRAKLREGALALAATHSLTVTGKHLVDLYQRVITLHRRLTPINPSPIKRPRPAVPLRKGSQARAPEPRLRPAELWRFFS
jgi:1,2-diacylglycerol-3-alpha-glucose alpha-1,2-glucosyltransferase